MKMMPKPVKYLRIAGIISLALFFSCQAGYAAFSLSVTPYEGGFDIRFGKIDVSLGRINKEFTVTLNSDIGTQYRLSQNFLDPPSTIEGVDLPQKALVVYAVRGSNKYGTLNVEQDTPILSGKQLLYTSNQAGDSDSFTLVYSLIPSPDIASGFYRGRIAFTLEPVNGAQDPVNVIMDISVDFSSVSSVEIKTETGSRSILLKPGREDSSSAGVIFDIKGGFGKQFRILQVIEEQPVSSDGMLLDWGAVSFVGQSAQKGTVPVQPQPLSARQDAVYTSSLQGAADSFVLEYALGDLSQQKAGRFRTKIKYVLEGVGFSKTQLLETLNFEVENPQVFDLVVAPESQKGAIEFRNLRPTDTEAKRNEIVIEVNSNTGKRYQVTQNVYSDLVNKAGEPIRAKAFTLRTESMDTLGSLRFPNAENVQKGYTVLFVSDKKGSSDKFKVIYELAPSRDLKSGDYSTRITYSLSEL